MLPIHVLLKQEAFTKPLGVLLRPLVVDSYGAFPPAVALRPSTPPSSKVHGLRPVVIS